MKYLPFLIFTYWFVNIGQSQNIKIVLEGEYSKEDSLNIVESIYKAEMAVQHMYTSINQVWNVDDSLSNFEKKRLRKELWNQDEHLSNWLGQPKKIRMVRRIIKRINNKFQHTIRISVYKDYKGRCETWVSAWTIPFGKTRIHICPNYLKYRKYLHEKTLIHELAHEVGLLFDRRIQGCWHAQRAAASSTNMAKHRPENYAWLAVSYLGIECGK